MRRCSHPECQPFGRCTKICPLHLVKICGREYEPRELAILLKKNADVFTQTGGGVTISGGEPLLQGRFTLELLKELRPVHRAVETSGYGPKEIFQSVAEEADLILIDLKMMDSASHRKWTGADNREILDNISWLMGRGKAFTARIPLIPRVNDSPENLASTAEFLSPAKGFVKVEILPYNPFAGAKYESVGLVHVPRFHPETKAFFDGSFFDKQGIEWRML